MCNSPFQRDIGEAGLLQLSVEFTRRNEVETGFSRGLIHLFRPFDHVRLRLGCVWSALGDDAEFLEFDVPTRFEMPVFKFSSIARFDFPSVRICGVDERDA